MTLIALGVTLGTFFLLAFLTKRRFGVLGLGLVAGLVLSEQVASEAAALLRYIDFPTEPFTSVNAARVLLIVLPSLLLMLAGPKYADKRHVLIGAIIFALFGTFLLLTPLLATFPSTDAGLQEYLGQVAFNSSLITAVAIIAAVFDLMKLHRKKPLDKKAKH